MSSSHRDRLRRPARSAPRPAPPAGSCGLRARRSLAAPSGGDCARVGKSGRGAAGAGDRSPAAASGTAARKMRRRALARACGSPFLPACVAARRLPRVARPRRRISIIQREATQRRPHPWPGGSTLSLRLLQMDISRDDGPCCSAWLARWSSPPTGKITKCTSPTAASQVDPLEIFRRGRGDSENTCVSSHRPRHQRCSRLGASKPDSAGAIPPASQARYGALFVGPTAPSRSRVLGRSSVPSATMPPSSTSSKSA